MLKKIKSNLTTTFFRLTSRISPRLNTVLRFYEKGGRNIDLDNPKTFSEKLAWLKLNRYAEHPLVRQCSDKLAVRSYVEQQGLGHLLNDLLGVWERAGDVDWDALPQQFALKWNFGSTYNYLCENKDLADRSAAIRQLKKWGRRSFWDLYAELQYKGVQKRLLCERFLNTENGEPLLDYKCYCFHGEPLAVLVIARQNGNDPAAVFMSPAWELLSDIPARYRKSLIPDRPRRLEEMLQAAKTLSAPFPFVRVDFFEWDGKLIFGEMTFTPGACIFPSETTLNGKSMGEYINLNRDFL